MNGNKHAHYLAEVGKWCRKRARWSASWGFVLLLIRPTAPQTCILETHVHPAQLGDSLPHPASGETSEGGSAGATWYRSRGRGTERWRGHSSV